MKSIATCMTALILVTALLCGCTPEEPGNELSEERVETVVPEGELIRPDTT